MEVWKTVRDVGQKDLVQKRKIARAGIDRLIDVVDSGPHAVRILIRQTNGHTVVDCILNQQQQKKKRSLTNEYLRQKETNCKSIRSNSKQQDGSIRIPPDADLLRCQRMCICNSQCMLESEHDLTTDCSYFRKIFVDIIRSENMQSENSNIDASCDLTRNNNYS